MKVNANYLFRATNSGDKWMEFRLIWTTQ